MRKIRDIFKDRPMRLAIFSVLTALVLCFAMLQIKGHSDIGDELVGMNDKKSQVLLTGEKYKMNYEQEKKQEEQEEKTRERNAEKLQAETQPSWTDSIAVKGGKKVESKDGKTNEASNSDKKSKEDEISKSNDKSPTVICSLVDGQQIKGEQKTFTLTARDYNGDIITSDLIEVHLNGVRLYQGEMTSKGRITYRNDEKSPLKSGANVFTIKVSDREDNTINLKYTVYADPTQEEYSKHTAYITVDARTVGLGYLIGPRLEVQLKKESESVAGFIRRNLMAYGYTLDGGNSTGSGYYLKAISKPGLMAGNQNGEKIPEELRKIIENRAGSLLPTSNVNSLAEKMFFPSGSGWMYSYNGEVPNIGLSNITVDEDDEIVLYYTLFMGYDYDGTLYNMGQ